VPEPDKSDARFTIAGQFFTAPALTPGLYVVATPIGNLKDVTIRALEVLAAVDLVLCEDTRQSAKLLDHYGIHTRRAALHEHNERARAGAIVDQLKEGAAIALISDAGTPLLSDPGFPLVRAATEAGQAATAIPGASALLAGLASAGLPTDRFAFLGFLPPKQGARRNALADLANRPETLVFYESPRRLAATLTDLATAFGNDRPAVVARELTKRFEEIVRGDLAGLATQFKDASVKGEIVILVAGAPEVQTDQSEWHAALEAALETQPLRTAVAEVTARFGLKRKDVYDAALAKKAQKG